MSQWSETKLVLLLLLLLSLASLYQETAVLTNVASGLLGFLTKTVVDHLSGGPNA